VNSARLLVVSNTSAATSELVDTIKAAGYELVIAASIDDARPLMDKSIDLLLLHHDHLDTGSFSLATGLRGRNPAPTLHLAATFASIGAPVGPQDFYLNSSVEPIALLSMIAALLNARREERLKDEFMSTVSHELRTPLNSILGWADILTRQPREADFSQGLQSIERNARLQAQMISDLLDVSRMAAGKLEIQLSPIEVDFVVDSAIKSVAAAAKARQISIDVRIEPGLPLLLADSERLQQILGQLLSNAVKFSAKNARVELDLRRDGEQLRISVADSGRGIPPERLPTLLSGGRGGASGGSGLGLGLSIATQLVALHGGRLSAASDGTGKGAVFTVWLPLVETR